MFKLYIKFLTWYKSLTSEKKLKKSAIRNIKSRMKYQAKKGLNYAVIFSHENIITEWAKENGFKIGKTVEVCEDESEYNFPCIIW